MTGRIAIALAAAFAAGLLAAGRPIGPRLLRSFGGDVEPRMVFQVDPGEHTAAELLPTWRARLPMFGIRVEPDPPLLRVTVFGARTRDRTFVQEALWRPGELAFYAVIEDAPVMRDAFQAARQDRWPDVQAEVDGWRHDETGRSFNDYFLMSSSRPALDAAIADLPLDEGQMIGVEQVNTYWRTYLLDREPMLTNRNVAHVSKIFDEYTSRPEVLVEFDAEGTRRFAEGTRRLVGHKMAIVLDDRVASAPVIQSEIAGGRSNISMGGGDYQEQDAEADALVAVLQQHGPPLPRGIAAMFLSAREPTAVGLWSVRLGFAAFVGLAVFLLAHVLVKRRAVLPAPGTSRATGGSPARAALAVAVSSGVPALLWIAERIQLPGMDYTDFVPVRPHVMMLGIAPALFGFVVVELVATLVPRLRRARLGNADGRARLDRAVPWVALLAALVLAWDRVDVLRGLEPYTGFTHFSGALARWTAILSLVTGAMLYVVAARVIARWGAGNPWAILIGAHALLLLVRLHKDVRWFDEARPTVLGVALVAAIATIALTRQRIGERRAPAAGIAPLLVLPALHFLRQLPGLRELDRHGYYLQRLEGIAPITEFALLAMLAAALSVLSGARRPSQLAAAILYVVALAWLDHLTPYSLRDAHPVLLGAALAVATAELLSGALRHARLRAAVALHVHHDLDRIDQHAATLAAAGIPVSVEGAAARATFRGFGAFSPIILRVPFSAAAQARAIPSSLGDPLTAEAAAVFD